MAILESCLCLNLYAATVLAGVITMLMYLVAFAIELWWIIEKNGHIQVPAYMLCTEYFILFFISVIMIAGIIGQKTRCILVWLFVVIILSLPEGGLVLYMSIVQWTLRKRNGLVELIFWICRAIINIINIIIVQSQYSLWTSEKQVIRQLQSLKMSPVLGNSNHKPSTVSKSTLSINESQHLRGYENLGFSSITEMSPVILVNGQDLAMSNGRIQRSLSSASQLQPPHANPMYGGSLPTGRPELDGWPPTHSLSSFGHLNDSEAVVYNPTEFPVDSNIELDPKSAVQLHSYRPRSLMYLDEDDYLTRPPPSRAVSLNYVNLHPAYSTQSLDRAKHFPRGDRKTTSLDALDMSYHQPGVHLQKLPMKPFDYLNRPGSKQSDMDNISDDARKIGDVAL